MVRYVQCRVQTASLTASSPQPLETLKPTNQLAGRQVNKSDGSGLLRCTVYEFFPTAAPRRRMVRSKNPTQYQTPPNRSMCMRYIIRQHSSPSLGISASRIILNQVRISTPKLAMCTLLTERCMIVMDLFISYQSKGGANISGL